MTAEVTPQQLVDGLNGATLKPIAVDRITRIIELLKWQQISRNLLGSRTAAERQKLLKLLSSTPGDFLELDDMLTRYWVSPRLIPLGDRWQMAYRTRSFDAGKRIASKPDHEVAAVMCVMHLAARNDLDRVRKCGCGKFFIASRLDQRYHDTRCRVQHHQSSEEFRAKRREYLREWYRLKTSGKVK